MKKNPWVIKTLVPEQVYTDREEFLEYFPEDKTFTGQSSEMLGTRQMVQACKRPYSPGISQGLGKNRS